MHAGLQKIDPARLFSYAKLELQPSPTDKLVDVYIDSELGNEAFTYVVALGAEGTVHIDHVLEYSQDSGHLRDLLLYSLLYVLDCDVELIVKERVPKSA